jgi:hypothetical protein
VVEVLGAIQNLIPYFFNYTSKLQCLSMSVLLPYKILGVVFFDATISSICCSAYRNSEQSAAMMQPYRCLCAVVLTEILNNQLP